jgi:nicotinate-nucleotide adenylyltransferase
VIQRVGVFGGTFDPVHVGHIVAAVDTRTAVGLDQVLMVVAGDPWQKRGEVAAPAADRFALVAAALEGIDGIEPSDVEIKREGPSITYDTLAAISAPGRELFLVLGSDAARNMPTWRKLEETRDLATLVIVERAGDAHAEAPLPGWPVERVTIPRLDIASSDLRARLAAGRPIHGLVPPAVVRAIAERGLYTRQ